MTDEHDTISFLASIPPTKTAITFEGEDRGGGELKLSVPGTDVAPLVRMLTLRGRVLRVTVAPQQSELPLGPAATAQAFPQAALFQEPVGDQAARVEGIGREMTVHIHAGTVPTADAEDSRELPRHVHRYREGVCLDCGEPAANAPRERTPEPAASLRARRVSRGLIPRGRKTARR